MQLTEHMALYLRGQGLDCVTVGRLPAREDEAVAVIAAELRPAADSRGSRVQVIARGSPGADSALDLSSRVLTLLDGFCGLFDPDSPLILRTRLEGGASKLETDGHGRAVYSMNFRVWHI